MHLTTTTHTGYTVVELTGRIDATAAEWLHACLSTLIESKETRLLIDCRQVEYLSSAGMRALFTATHAAREGGGDLICCGFIPTVREVLALANVEKLLVHYDDYDDALATLNK